MFKPARILQRRKPVLLIMGVVAFVSMHSVLDLEYRVYRIWENFNWHVSKDPDTPMLNSDSGCNQNQTSGDEMQQLGFLVQRTICKLQNPRNCSGARKLLCRLRPRCGLGCQQHHVGICLFLAIGTNRTLVVDSEYFRDVPLGLEEAYLPLSKSCRSITQSDLNEAVDIKGDGRREITHDHRIVKLKITGGFDPFTDFAPFLIPRSLKRIGELHDKPHVWFVGQVMKYVTRLQPTLAHRISELKRKIDFVHPVVGIHVRRTDKKSEANFYDLDYYINLAAAWFDKHAPKAVPRQIFLATDEMEVYKEALAKYPSYKFLTLIQSTETIHHTSAYTHESFMGIVVDIKLLSECDFVVCTFSSNVGRLVYEIMMADRRDEGNTTASLDSRYFYIGQHASPQFVKFEAFSSVDKLQSEEIV